MNSGFSTWLDRELQTRGWSQSEAARRGAISSQMVNAVVNGQANPGLDFCKGIARAFKLPLDDVFRLAGILPTPPAPPPQTRERRIVYNVNTDELVLDLWHALGHEDQAIVHELMERLAQLEPRIIGEPPEEKP